MNSNVTGSSSPDSFAKNPRTDLSSLVPTDSDNAISPESQNVIPPPTAVEEAAPANFQVLEGTDSMDKSDIVTQYFSATPQRGNQNIYQASAQLPLLPLPDPEGSMGPQPFEPSWQKATNDFFKNLVRESLIKKNKEGKNLESRVNTILQTLIAGKAGTLSAEDQEIVKKATKETQQAWSLPDSWSIGTQEIKNWKPTKIDVIAPVNVDIARKELFCLNVEELLIAIEKVGQKAINELPPNDPTRLAVGDLVRIISQAIRDLKEILRELQLQEAKTSIVLSRGKFEQIQERKKELEEHSKKIDESTEARHKQEEISKKLKIGAFIASIVVTALGIASLLFTGGASLSLVIAGLAISSITLTYTVADQFLDLTSKAVQACGKLIEKIAPGDDNPWKSVIKALVLALLVIIFIAAVVSSGGAAIGSVATGITGQVIKQAAIETMKQVTLQMAPIAMMSSNIFPELLLTSLLKLGIIDGKDEKTKMIVQMIVMAVSALAIFAGATAGLGGAKGAGGFSIGQAINSIGDTVKNIGQTISNIAQAIKEGVATAMQQIKEMIKSLQRMLTQLITSISDLPLTEILKGIPSKTAELILQSIQRTVDAAKGIKSLIASGTFLDAIKTSTGQVATSVQTASAQALEQLNFLAEQFKKAAAELIEQLTALGKQVAAKARDEINQASDAVKAAVSKGIEYLKSLPHEILDSAKQSIKAHWEGIKFFSKQEDIASIFQNTQDFFRAAGFGAEFATGISNGYFGYKLQELYREIGEMEKAQEMTNLLLKLFDKLLNSFQEGMGKNSEWLNNLENALESLYASASQTLTKATQSAV